MDTTSERNREIEKRRNQEDLANRVDQLITTVENYTRSERHLEQHSDIGDPRNIDHATDIQSQRKSEIDHLKNTIVYGPEYDDNNLANLRENLEDTEEYLNSFGDKMSQSDLDNIKRKQQNRLNSLDQME